MFCSSGPSGGPTTSAAEVIPDYVEQQQVQFAEIKSLIEVVANDVKKGMQPLQGIENAVEAVQEKVSDVTANVCMTTAIRDFLKCHYCQQTIKENVVIDGQCGQIIGCGSCVERGMDASDRCPLCNSEAFLVVRVKGMDNILQLLK